MAQSLPWSVKGIDPDTREAAREAARRAGMTIGEWLDHVIREEAGRVEPDDEEPESPRRSSASTNETEGLHERLKRLSRPATGAAVSGAALRRAERSQAPVRDDAALRALVTHAERLDARARAAEERTTGALESIVSWIEKAEGRMAQAERATAERQERTASVIAEAIKTVSSRVAQVEQVASTRLAAAPSAVRPAAPSTVGPDGSDVRPAAAPQRAALSRERLQSAVSEIRNRQRDLDRIDGEPSTGPSTGADPAAGQRGVAMWPHRERRSGERNPDVTPLMNSLRADLAQLRSEIAGLGEAPRSSKLEDSIADLARLLHERPTPASLSDVQAPLARIEAEIGRLAGQSGLDRLGGMERELARIVERIETVAEQAQEPRILSAAVRELAGLREEIARAASPQRLDDLMAQIQRLSGEIAGIRNAVGPERALEGVDSALRDMRESLARETREVSQIGHGLMQRISHQLETVGEAIAGLNAGGGLEDADRGEIAALSRRLDQLAERTQPESDLLARKIEALAIKLDDLSRPEDTAVIARIDALSGKLDQLSAVTPDRLAGQLERLAQRIETLSLASEQQAGPRAAAPAVDLSPIETMIGQLARRIEDAARPDAGADHLRALEMQIARLGQRLDERPAAAVIPDALERTLQDLMRSLGGLRDETASAVDRAARAAVQEVMAGDGNPLQGGPIPELSSLRQDLAGLMDAHASIDRRTHAALGQVSETLDQIVARLAQLEGELTQARPVSAPPIAAPAPSAPAPSQPLAPMVPARRSQVDEIPGSADRPRRERPEAPLVTGAGMAGDMAVTDLRAPTPPLLRARPADAVASSGSADALALADLPLEPGSGRPRPRTDGTPNAGLNPNLIAAARRAAQAASAEAEALKAETGAKDKGGRKLQLSLKEAIEKRRKPILLGLAAIVLAMGAGQVATTLLGEREVPVSPAAETQVQATPDAAGQTRAEPPRTEQSPNSGSGQPSQPVKDQTSALTPPAVSTGAPPAPPASESVSPQTTGAIGRSSEAPARMAEPATVRVTGLGDLPASIGTAGMRRAALEGDPNAVYELASRAADGVGMSRDPRLALRLFERAAAAGHAPSQFRIANLYEKGISVQRDARQAVAWYRRAAEQGNAKAMHNLAVLLAEGADGKPDFADAARLFRSAAELGVRDSQYNLAILLGRGLGLEQDLPQAYVWFAVAARQGDADAGRKRDEIGAKLTPADLAAARSAAQNWKPRTPDPAANEAVAPTAGWDPQPARAPQPSARPRSS